MKKLTLLLLIFPVALILFSCKTYNEDDKTEFDEKISKYIEKNKIEGMQRSDSGLYYKIIEPGSDRKILYEDEVHFKYKGKLTNGTVFDDQTKEGQTFKLRDLIAAWKEIMLELGEGGKAYIITPPQLGYGDHELNKIPQNSILIYDIEIVEVI